MIFRIWIPRRVFFLHTTLHGPNTLSHRLEPLLILLMVQKSCTTWHLWNPANNGIYLYLGCDIGGAKELGVIYFPTSGGAKEPQNPPNHRVDIHIFTISTGAGFLPATVYHLPNLSMFYSFDVLLFHFSSLLTENEHVQTKKEYHFKRKSIIFQASRFRFFFVGYSLVNQRLQIGSAQLASWKVPHGISQCREVHGRWSASSVFLHGIRWSRNVARERFNNEDWGEKIGQVFSRRWMCNRCIEIHRS